MSFWHRSLNSASWSPRLIEKTPVAPIMTAANPKQKTLVVYAKTLVVGDGNSFSPGVMLVDRNGDVSWVGSRDSYPDPDAETVVRADLVIPGFVDIHNHGIGGADDVQGFWTNPEHTLREVCVRVFRLLHC